MGFENRQYVIFDVTELGTINFTQVLETSADTVRRSMDGTKTFVKWDGEVPECVVNLTTRGDYLTHGEIMEIMSTPEWTDVSEIY